MAPSSTDKASGRHADPELTRRTAPQRWLDLSDPDLLAQCELDTYRASGPGGQKRNKTSSAVRLRHRASGLMVVATESRSQHENRARALRRLRRAIALTQRSPIASGSEPPPYVRRATQADPPLRISPRHVDYLKIVQYILDLLVDCRGSVGDAAGRLGVSTAQFVRFMQQDPRLWEQANRLRHDFGLKPLT